MGKDEFVIVTGAGACDDQRGHYEIWPDGLIRCPIREVTFIRVGLGFCGGEDGGVFEEEGIGKQCVVGEHVRSHCPAEGMAHEDHRNPAWRLVEDVREVFLKLCGGGVELILAMCLSKRLRQTVSAKSTRYTWKSSR